MTKDQALKHALEKFEFMNHVDSIFHGEFDFQINAIKKALAQKAEPVAWPKTPSDISNMIGSSFVWREHKISDVEPHEEDKYCVTAHDLLEAFEHWSGYTSPPPRQPEQPKVRTGNCLRVGVCASEGHKIALPLQPLTDEQISLVREMRDVQGYDGNWNYDPYMQGLYNGLEFAVSLLEKREPVFRDAPEQWLGDISKKRDNFNIVGSKTAAHGIKGEA